MNSPPAYLPDQVLVPSDPLRARLSVGFRATLISGGISAGGWLAESISGDQPGLTPARALGLLAMVPSLWIARTYAALGWEVGRISLGKGAWSVFGAILLLQLFDLATQQVLPTAARALLWYLVAIGLILLPVLPFLPDLRTSALVAAAVLTWAGQVILAAFAFAGAIGGLGVDWEAVAGGVAALLAVGFLLWFGAAKVRARRRLGGIAALLGWTEILGILFSILWVVAGYSIAIAVVMNAGDPEPSDKLMAALDDKIARGVAALSLLGDLTWTSLTAWFFLSIRRRRGPDPGPRPGDPSR
jgi:hypothetical protein